MQLTYGHFAKQSVKTFVVLPLPLPLHVFLFYFSFVFLFVLGRWRGMTIYICICICEIGGLLLPLMVNVVVSLSLLRRFAPTRPKVLRKCFGSCTSSAILLAACTSIRRRLLAPSISQFTRFILFSLWPWPNTDWSPYANTMRKHQNVDVVESYHLRVNRWRKQLHRCILSWSAWALHMKTPVEVYLRI